MIKSWRFLVLLGCAAVLGCGSSSPPPLRLGVPSQSLPAPGLCRVLLEGYLPRRCDGIANIAPLDSRVAYRFDDGSRNVAVCYMDSGARGVVTGIDIFEIDRGRLVSVQRRYADPHLVGDCDDAVLGLAPEVDYGS